MAHNRLQAGQFCAARGAGRKIAYAILRACFYVPLNPWAASGIEAESPQDLHEQIRGLAAESPVFLPGRGQKKAPK
jgi:hypothetical protein